MLVAAVGLAALAAALALYLLVEKVGAAGLPLAVLRAAAWGALGALLVNPGCRHTGALPAVVLLDHSLSMSAPRDTAGGGARWRAALDTARALAGSRGRILLFGVEPQALPPGRTAVRPDAPATRLLPAWREAAALGGAVTVVTDGEVDDAASLPADFRREARVVLLPRPATPDVGVAALDLPAALRAGDTATADVVLAAAHLAPSDSATLELLEDARVVARTRVAVGGGGGGTFRRELRFVPAAPAGRGTARFTARVSGVPDDGEPRDDARTTAAEVSRASAIALFSDSPDWDFRWLAATLRRTSGVPVSAWVRLAPQGPWLDADSLRPASRPAVEAAARAASLVVVHGSAEALAPIAALARHALWRWTGGGAGLAGDWYAAPAASASPVGGALAGVSPDSLPPLTAVAPARTAAGEWTALAARLGRQGAPRPVIVGSDSGGRPEVRMLGWGLWRWASQGGVAAEGYRALVAALTDWSLAQAAGGGRAPALTALRDSLGRGADELLPRPVTLPAQAGAPAAEAGTREPLRNEPWVYGMVLVALMLEWIARRRRGMR